MMSNLLIELLSIFLVDTGRSVCVGVFSSNSQIDCSSLSLNNVFSESTEVVAFSFVPRLVSVGEVDCAQPELAAARMPIMEK